VLRTIDLARPEFIVCLGSTPTQRLLGLTDGILKTRGAWREFRGTPVLPTLHPAYLLRQPAQKRLAWRDLLSLKRKLIA
jgi:uracil-DNA glycosylase family 4